MKGVARFDGVVMSGVAAGVMAAAPAPGVDRHEAVDQ